MRILLKKEEGVKTPSYQSEGSAGFDISAHLEKSIVIKSFSRCIIPTGLYFEIPEGYEMQIRPRSGLALKHGITVLNTPGTIDSDYRGEIKIVLVNLSDEDFVVNDGDRIAQAIVAPYTRCDFEITDTLSDTIRADGGFGSSGV
ncbi:MAG TPA: dUTP diphosphatase [Candidatus Ornithospirochaeta avicola]|uniref:Deoxyuridine 5'-triphosphate nucleotidohydrolase n=1 Tax=Candidatus Ornithospirochaeta avicola TaxID=2840896 RepID=A0A9D1PRL1_9SPIO|nr:dUTP diphosphatase [Candidatus Ornithospirochaeta avicola]